MRIIAAVVFMLLTTGAQAGLIWEFNWDDDVSSGSGSINFGSESGSTSTRDGAIVAADPFLDREDGGPTIEASWNYLGESFSCSGSGDTACGFHGSWEIDTTTWEFTALDIRIGISTEILANPLKMGADINMPGDFVFFLQENSLNLSLDGSNVTCNDFRGLGCGIDNTRFLSHQADDIDVTLAAKHASVPEPSALLLLLGGLALVKSRRIGHLTA